MNMEISKITTIDKENQIIFPYQPPKKRWGFPKVFFFPPPSSRRPPWTLRYPSRYEQVLSALCESMEALDEPEAKASMIWILGEYVSRHIWGSPYMDPRIRCLERNLGYTFGGVKYLLKRYLDTKNMNNASIFFAVGTKKMAVCNMFSVGLNPPCMTLIESQWPCCFVSSFVVVVTPPLGVLKHIFSIYWMYCILYIYTFWYSVYGEPNVHALTNNWFSNQPPTNIWTRLQPSKKRIYCCCWSPIFASCWDDDLLKLGQVLLKPTSFDVLSVSNPYWDVHGI